ncbi:hypothetical protein [Oligoflexus tunisiensis]|uniref:hypothetical protein n=1 Tax=Oligoflexus tunisiensis TaxID=708132 RepID=UPI00114D0365|nr:hypothetical protein [Oligoflexus tunisiensis]
MKQLCMSCIMSGFVLAPWGCTKSAPVPASVRVEDIKENPALYLGKEVTVSGEIEKVFGTRAFQLGGTDFFDSEIRVLTNQPLKESVRRRAEEPFRVDDIALVTGTLRNIVVADVEREFNFDLDPSYEVEFQNKPAIVATSVLISPRGQATESATTDGTMNHLQTILDSQDKASLAGKKVELQQVEVQSVIGDQSFWIGPSPSQQVFVTFAEIPTPGKPMEGQVAIKAGQKVNLSGVIRSMPTLSEEWLKRNKIDDRTASLLRQQAIYIQSTEIKVAGAEG